MRQRGAAFVFTLAVLAVLTALLAGAVATERLEFRAQLHRMEARKARLAAESGVEYAKALLAEQQPGAINRDLEWFTLATPGEQGFQTGQESFRIEIVDEASFVNLNTATQAQLESLRLTTEQIDSLLDWREAGSNPRAEGAKDQFYNELTEPYNAKLRGLDSVDELLLIKGFTANAIYEYQEEATSTGGAGSAIDAEQLCLYDLSGTDSRSPNTAANGQPKLNLNNATIGQLIQRGVAPPIAVAILQARPQRGFTGFGQVLRVQGMDLQTAANLLDNATVTQGTTAAGKLNVNTAKEAALASLPGMQPDVVQSILSRQDPGLASMTELTRVPGVTLQQLQQWGDLVAVGTSRMRIRVVGASGSARYSMEAVVELGTEPRTIRQWEPPATDMASRWRWEEDAVNMTTLSGTDE